MKNTPNFFSNKPIQRIPSAPPAGFAVVQHPVTSLLERMKDGREYESIIGLKNVQVDLGAEIHRSLEDIVSVRGFPCLCYIANMITPPAVANISINPSDEKPFIEMIDAVPPSEKEIDIILVTPGGSAEIVSTLVTKLRSRFEKVNFILPYMAMSAGTIFCMSGDELIMDENASFGPIDPQVPTKDGRYVPAQALMTLLTDIQERGKQQLETGKQPLWTDVLLVQSIDKRELGNVITASRFSTNLVSEYLNKYKFRTWTEHSDGRTVTEAERAKRASDIAKILCDHSKWLNHASRISRDQAWEECRIKITPTESVEGLARAVRRLWALMCYAFEVSPVYKCFLSENYTLFRLAQNNPENKIG